MHQCLLFIKDEKQKLFPYFIYVKMQVPELNMIKLFNLE